MSIYLNHKQRHLFLSIYSQSANITDRIQVQTLSVINMFPEIKHISVLYVTSMWWHIYIQLPSSESKRLELSTNLPYPRMFTQSSTIWWSSSIFDDSEEHFIFNNLAGHLNCLQWPLRPIFYVFHATFN